MEEGSDETRTTLALLQIIYLELDGSEEQVCSVGLVRL
jgi:hypothetical protein